MTSTAVECMCWWEVITIWDDSCSVEDGRKLQMLPRNNRQPVSLFGGHFWTLPHADNFKRILNVIISLRSMLCFFLFHLCCVCVYMYAFRVCVHMYAFCVGAPKGCCSVSLSIKPLPKINSEKKALSE